MARRSPYLLSVATYALLTVVPSARSQETRELTSQNQGIEPAQESPSSTVKPQVRRVGHVGAFREFIGTTGWENDRNQRQIQEGHVPDNPTEDWPKKATRVVPLTENEWQAVYTIVLDAYYQMKEHDREWSTTVDQLHEDPSPELQAKVDALSAQRPKLYVDTITKLKQELGDESFKKLDSFVYQAYGGRTIIGEGLPAKAANPSSTPNPVQPPSKF